MNTDELYGLWVNDPTNILEVTAEECSELVQAVTKIMRYGVNDERKLHLAEEISDVRICIEAMCRLYRESLDLNDVDLAESAKKCPDGYVISASGEIIDAVGMVLFRKDLYGRCEFGTDTTQLRVMLSNLEYGIEQLIKKHGIQDGDLTRWRTMKLERMEQRLTHGL